MLLVIVLKMKKFKIKNAIIICSEPRGGSTWLMEIFNELPFTVVNLEPLHVNSGVVPKEFNFGWYPYLPKKVLDKKIELFFFKVFTLKIFNKWTTGFISLKKVVWSKLIITKFVLANQLLPWIVVNFSDKLRYKPIFLVRHPVTTCISQLKTFHKVAYKDLFKPLAEKEKFIVPMINFNERFKKHEVYINSLNSKLERQVALWCINNSNLFNHEDNNKWVTVFYENLIENPENEFFNLLTSLKIKFNPQNLKRINFKKPSYSNFNKDYKVNVNEQLQSSLSKFSRDELQKLQDVFNYFNVVQYSAFSAYPIGL